MRAEPLEWCGVVLTESYGRICPVCDFDRMLVRYGSSGYFQFDACPKCGFGYGTNEYDSEVEHEKLWEIIIEHDSESLLARGFPLSRQGYLEWVMTWTVPREDSRSEGAFSYDDKYLAESALRLGVFNGRLIEVLIKLGLLDLDKPFELLSKQSRTRP